MKQSKRDEKQNSKKLHLDKYYTPEHLVDYCINKTYEIIGISNITEIIEPSAGNGAFSSKIPNCIAYDLEPESDSITQADYLKLDLPYKEGRLIIGNPPYGSRLNLAKAFCNKSFEIADYVSFILPISQLKNTQTIYKFDLIHSEDLSKQSYSGIEVHCCLNIYKRPSGGLNSAMKFRNSKIIDVLEIRETIGCDNLKRKEELKNFKYDFAICAWGSIGKECAENEYAKTFYIKINDVEYEKLKDKSDYGNLIITKGARGAEYDGILYPGQEVSVYDVVGAGDTFLSALVYGFLKTKKIQESIPLANKAAAIAVAHQGTYVLTQEDIHAICN
jgi:predicted RNA methylase